MTDGTKKLLSGLAAMFNDGIHWDFVVKADPLEFKILKSIVGIHLEVFERMFAADMAEGNTNEVEIKDQDPQAIEALLQYCYTGTLDDPQWLESWALAATYCVAHCYQVLELVEECRRWAFVKMSVKDVLEWLTVGYTYEDGHLTHGCLDFFFRHMEEVQALPEFPEFVEQNPPIAVELLRLVTADRKQLLEVNQMQKDLIEAQKNKLERRNRHE